MVAEVLSVIAPVFLIAALGYVWARLDKPFDSAMVTQLTVAVTTPCLIVDTFLRASISMEAFGRMVAATLVLYALMALLGFTSLLLLRWRQSHFLPSLIFGNTGNMGLPLCLFAFGEEGLALGITLFAVSTILNFTLGPSIAAGSISPKQILRMPILYAVVGAVTILITGLRPPHWLGETIHLLGGVTIPMMILALGVSLARLKIVGLGRALVLTSIRIGGGMVLAFPVAWLFEVEGAARGVLIVQAAMPAAVFNFLFAERYSSAGSDVAGVVLVSSLVSVATTPALLWFLLPA
ncbi:MAG: AEC family transporter [Rhodospirillales bacterium]|nr:AEC family transporter [Rhodospirillales bacterium]